ncbi:Asp-tRNA(Asn)/Glu-tRNA(Gln) amidotransferase subunit GatA [Nonomuraea deserti]|uniref:Asp-tRNA(Asn)/Glu-tRNA(Gln) amidotransferase subunit GatA n=1 Tax=Nonomuraea deserti TaxID=1848322 RepID=A0A4R4UVE7_9ACTN|nr:amidase [Nonomuraea deserti]TDC96110.1 Asp-tRNA(Asn)/Glu-tRNA(Gln) amidotransferase subunit GatA [Nonomuraea deserti]
MHVHVHGQEAGESIARTSQRLRTARLTSEELTRTALDRIDRHDRALNAVVTAVPEQALDAARRIDRDIQAGRDRGVLQGIPVGLKDVIDVRDVTTAMGSAFYQNRVPRQDATLVRRLRRAGAVIVGKLHTQEFAYGATGSDAYTGPGRNPHAQDRVTGGSSSGPAAAVAAGFCLAAVGTDTGGSVRIPAALCGVVGLKPTAGRISRTGVFPLSWTLDQVGPITRSVADNAALLGVLCGFDPQDGGSVRRAAEDFGRHIPAGVEGLRIGLPRPYFDHLDPDVRRCIEAALNSLQDLGAAVQLVDMPELERIVSIHRTVLSVEAHAVHRQRLDERPELFQEPVRQRLYAAAALPAWSYAEAYRRRRLARTAFDNALTGVDVLAAPTVPVPAPLIGQVDVTTTGLAETVQSALTRLTGATNLSGHPSLSVPCGRTRTGLPVGMQLIGRFWDEAMLYRVGQAVENGAVASPAP